MTIGVYLFIELSEEESNLLFLHGKETAQGLPGKLDRKLAICRYPIPAPP